MGRKTVATVLMKVRKWTVREEMALSACQTSSGVWIISALTRYVEHRGRSELRCCGNAALMRVDEFPIFLPFTILAERALLVFATWIRMFSYLWRYLDIIMETFRHPSAIKAAQVKAESTALCIPWTLESMYAFKCKHFRNARHTVTFRIPLLSS
jgi:hypothetical protein